MPRKQAETTDSVVFNGITFRRYPNAKRLSDRRYYRADGRLRKQGISYLHKTVWEFYNGKVPDGYHIHHKNGDTLDNRIENLELLPGKSHLALHAEENRHNEALMARLKENLAEQQAKAAEWHRSEAGREWHRQHGRETAEAEANKPRAERICKVCGKSFLVKNFVRDRAEFCSNKCYSKYRRDNGLDDITVKCPICGKEYSTNKYKPAKTCGKRCGAILSGRSRKR